MPCNAKAFPSASPTPRTVKTIGPLQSRQVGSTPFSRQKTFFKFCEGPGVVVHRPGTRHVGVTPVKGIPQFMEHHEVTSPHHRNEDALRTVSYPRRSSVCAFSSISRSLCCQSAFAPTSLALASLSTQAASACRMRLFDCRAARHTDLLGKSGMFGVAWMPFQEFGDGPASSCLF